MREPAVTAAAARAEVRDTWPFFVIVVVMVLVGYVTALRSQAALANPLTAVLFTVLVLISIALFLLSPVGAIRDRRAFFVLAQGAVIFAIGVLIPYHWLALGLYPGLLGMAIGLYWGELWPLFGSASLCIGLLVGNVALGGGWLQLRAVLPTALFCFLFVAVYVVLFMRQIDARQRTQTVLEELEEAHRSLRDYAERVEELTLGHERERMGRELHDTLAQGLAGLILQLEAIGADLETGNVERARTVVERAVERARSSLTEARRAIMALRASALEQGDLRSAVAAEIDEFRSTSGGLSCRTSISVSNHLLDTDGAQDLLRILQECLANIGRHAMASHVSVELELRGRTIRLHIEDDGQGFDSHVVGPGLGLQGMRERAERLGAELAVESALGRGTRITLRSAGSPR